MTVTHKDARFIGQLVRRVCRELHGDRSDPVVFIDRIRGGKGVSVKVWGGSRELHKSIAGALSWHFDTNTVTFDNPSVLNSWTCPKTSRVHVSAKGTIFPWSK